MDFDDTPEEAAFRREARSWLEANAPVKGDPDDFWTAQQLGTVDEFEYVKRCKEWQARLAESGWAGITWPREYGGRGGSSLEAQVFEEEQRRLGTSTGVFAVGIGMAGPTIVAHGTDEQKRRWLPPLLHGDEVYCQLFSEPEAGSDLANVKARALDDGEAWVVTGQKLWTSGAHYSDWGILLARTDPDQPKHRGITYFVVAMNSPGIEIRPLRQITGASHFSEVFLADVRIPHENVVGEPNGGWGVAMTTLANERVLIGGGVSGPTFADLLDLARAYGRTDDPVIRQGLADAFTRLEIIGYLRMRVRTATSRGVLPGPEASTMKLSYASYLKASADLAMAIQGPAAALAGDDAHLGGTFTRHFLSAPSIRIAGGTDEIQRNVIGERVLGLPREARLDKNIPFRQIGSGVS